jgi:hypothetical protein
MSWIDDRWTRVPLWPRRALPPRFRLRSSPSCSGSSRGADSVELKLTVPFNEKTQPGAKLGVDPPDAQIRQVNFFDTPELALNENGVVVRARRVQKKGDDSVVKLRPIVPDELPRDLRRSPAFVVEVDAMPGGFTCSGTMKPTHPRTLHWKTSRSSARSSCSS